MGNGSAEITKALPACCQEKNRPFYIHIKLLFLVCSLIPNKGRPDRVTRALRDTHPGVVTYLSTTQSQLLPKEVFYKQILSFIPPLGGVGEKEAGRLSAPFFLLMYRLLMQRRNSIHVEF
ncbi:hypothetical protein AVEN_169946-1 [Araneus ventricosus]|uniref:Uncharacterized protein n=1 Tax=Araneus ventricosus TaxID=182803 RepID=A0A4Y2B635_ARAVE|nr:hypothetical protein AVEN_246193-1 [Araneus ventricosus]GBL87643.1 hypothetical protein AVEN_256594-1 [Araneus ventricosus]GBL87670.1 hypothetical protein AVEN_190789-1 [Araneus ventricosus]GBL87717.1 hypothetical protein AVEN_169946-1 [Araneus ventricosus]